MPFVFYLFRPLKHRNQMCRHHWSMLNVTQHQQNCKVTNQLCHLNSNKPNLCNQMLILQVFAPSQHNTTQHHKTPAQQQINPTKLFSINVTQCIETVTMTSPSFETTLLSPQPSSKHTSSEKYPIKKVISMTTIYFVTSNQMKMVVSIRSLCFDRFRHFVNLRNLSPSLPHEVRISRQWFRFIRLLWKTQRCVWSCCSRKRNNRTRFWRWWWDGSACHVFDCVEKSSIT